MVGAIVITIKNPKQTIVDNNDSFSANHIKKYKITGFSDTKASFFVVLKSSILNGPVSVILCAILVSNTCDLSTFPHLNDIQETCKQVIHENNMKQFANLYYNYKMDVASKFNAVLDISNKSNLNILTSPVNSVFNPGKVYLNTPVNIWLPTIAIINYIIKAKYIILPCLVITLLSFKNIFISSLDILEKSL